MESKIGRKSLSLLRMGLSLQHMGQKQPDTKLQHPKPQSLPKKQSQKKTQRHFNKQHKQKFMRLMDKLTSTDFEYKIGLCGSYEHKGRCAKGEDCNLAHSNEERRRPKDNKCLYEYLKFLEENDFEAYDDEAMRSKLGKRRLDLLSMGLSLPTPAPTPDCKNERGETFQKHDGDNKHQLNNARSLPNLTQKPKCKTESCRKFLAGECRMGKRCKYAHDEKESKSTKPTAFCRPIPKHP